MDLLDDLVQEHPAELPAPDLVGPEANKWKWDLSFTQLVLLRPASVRGPVDLHDDEASSVSRGDTDQEVWMGYVQGDLGDYGVKLPWAENGVDIVLGAEYRNENLNYSPDDASQAGDVGGDGRGGAAGMTSGVPTGATPRVTTSSRSLGLAARQPSGCHEVLRTAASGRPPADLCAPQPGDG